MKTMRESWEETKIIGRVWYCGDEVCDCTQALIERVTPNRESGPPWIRRETLWQGRFYSGSSEQPWKDDGSPSPEDDLKAHLSEFGAVMESDYYAQVEKL